MSGNPEAWDFPTATERSRRAHENQTGAEQARVKAAEELAFAERLYRTALARRIVELNAEGAAWTVCQDLARGDKAVADLRYERDVKKGVLDAAEQAAWKFTADRKDVNEFVQWSRVVAPLGEQHEPAVRRAA
jgi:hypothetical protein